MNSKQVDTLKKHYAVHGITGCAARVLRKIVSKVITVHRSLWFEKNLHDGLRAPVEAHDIEIITNDFDRIEQWIRVQNETYPWMYNHKEMTYAKANKHVIAFAVVKEQIVGYTKVALNAVYIRDYDTYYPLAENKAMFYDTTVLPDFRGQKIPFIVKHELFRTLKNNGIDKIYAHIEPWNIASIKSNQKVGFMALGVNLYVNLLGMAFHSKNPAALLG